MVKSAIGLYGIGICRHVVQRSRAATVGGRGVLWLVPVFCWTEFDCVVAWCSGFRVLLDGVACRLSDDVPTASVCGRCGLLLAPVVGWNVFGCVVLLVAWCGGFRVLPDGVACRLSNDVPRGCRLCSVVLLADSVCAIAVFVVESAGGVMVPSVSSCGSVLAASCASCRS